MNSRHHRTFNGAFVGYTYRGNSNQQRNGNNSHQAPGARPPVSQDAFVMHQQQQQQHQYQQQQYQQQQYQQQHYQ